MNALVKKEIRLLLPGWLAILALEVALPWLCPNSDVSLDVIPFFFFLVMSILAGDSFGREFSLGTFSSLLSQPMERRQIWRAKITVLFIGAALIFVAYWASCELRFHQGLKNPAWHLIAGDFHNAMIGSGVAWFVALTGGLWTALLLRQAAAAFWITLLAPAGILVMITLCLPEKWAGNDHIVIPLLFSGAGIYMAAGFWLAHRLFHRAQDVAWTGGVISFSTWRYFEAGSKSSVSMRCRKPIIALLKKEFQLQSISLFCAGALLGLHLGVFFLRIFYANHHKASLAAGVSDYFWSLWMVIPLVIGCTAVAEERKLGMAENQVCLPASQRVQFAIKFIPVMILGTLLGGVMPILLETTAACLGAPSEFFKAEHLANHDFISACVSMGALAAGLTGVAFFASTLARSFLQALSIAMVIATGCWLVVAFIAQAADQFHSFFEVVPLHLTILPVLIAIPTIAVMYLWLAGRNFSHFQENGRLWRRNLLGIAGAALFIVASSAAIHCRIWEIFESAEPPHGPAKFSSAHLPTMQNGHNNSLLVRLPDGRVWYDTLDYWVFESLPNRWTESWWTLTRPLPKSGGPQQFIADSNWVSAIARHIDFWDPAEGPRGHVVGYLDTVGIQTDGTLWISSEARPVIWTGAKMVRFGDETNWQQIVRSYPGLLLLKKDGTLWRWGTNRFDWSQWQTNWPSVRAFKPQQIGTNSDWQEIVSTWTGYARKTDGSVWSIGMDWKTEKNELARQTNLDQIVFQSFSASGEGSSAYVGKDGTLWLWVDSGYWVGSKSLTKKGYSQVGKETNWLAVAMLRRGVVALKSDGTLWRWNFPHDAAIDVANIPLKRMGIHSDWVCLTATWNGVASLAADGSLWFWPGPEYGGALMKPPKQPQYLGNVLGKAN